MMLRMIVNENLSNSMIRELRNRGHDVLSVKESLSGASDMEILELAQQELRIVVTQDKDFGELAFRNKIDAPAGIILFRLAGESPQADVQRMISAIESRSDWDVHFVVITDDRIRMRPLV